MEYYEELLSSFSEALSMNQKIGIATEIFANRYQIAQSLIHSPAAGSVLELERKKRLLGVSQEAEKLLYYIIGSPRPVEFTDDSTEESTDVITDVFELDDFTHDKIFDALANSNLTESERKTQRAKLNQIAISTNTTAQWQQSKLLTAIILGRSGGLNYSELNYSTLIYCALYYQVLPITIKGSFGFFDFTLALDDAIKLNKADRPDESGRKYLSELVEHLWYQSAVMFYQLSSHLNLRLSLHGAELNSAKISVEHCEILFPAMSLYCLQQIKQSPTRISLRANALKSVYLKRLVECQSNILVPVLGFLKNLNGLLERDPKGVITFLVKQTSLPQSLESIQPGIEPGNEDVKLSSFVVMWFYEMLSNFLEELTSFGSFIQVEEQFGCYNGLVRDLSSTTVKLSADLETSREELKATQDRYRDCQTQGQELSIVCQDLGQQKLGLELTVMRQEGTLCLYKQVFSDNKSKLDLQLNRLGCYRMNLSKMLTDAQLRADGPIQTSRLNRASFKQDLSNIKNIIVLVHGQLSQNIHNPLLNFKFYFGRYLYLVYQIHNSIFMVLISSLQCTHGHRTGLRGSSLESLISILDYINNIYRCVFDFKTAIPILLSYATPEQDMPDMNHLMLDFLFQVISDVGKNLKANAVMRSDSIVVQGTQLGRIQCACWQYLIDIGNLFESNAIQLDTGATKLALQ